MLFTKQKGTFIVAISRITGVTATLSLLHQEVVAWLLPIYGSVPLETSKSNTELGEINPGFLRISGLGTRQAQEAHDSLGRLGAGKGCVRAEELLPVGVEVLAEVEGYVTLVPDDCGILGRYLPDAA
ncbi:MAG: hypothetical protein PWP12_746 [Bacillota bacterium]|nr:hypothetical protein [Bacillota bacterium]MDK2882733.1 hypothetical protein [Bacillota bacterium]MDK2960562.1 hypothetical protein [Bacillota bacterium]